MNAPNELACHQKPEEVIDVVPWGGGELYELLIT